MKVPVINLLFALLLSLGYQFVHALDYFLYEAKHCMVTKQIRGGFQFRMSPSDVSIMRCPINVEKPLQSNRIRIRLHTLNKQDNPNCFIAGSTHANPTFYRFSKFQPTQSPISNDVQGAVLEATLGGEHYFVSESEGTTWKMHFEIQCYLTDKPFLHSYTVLKQDEKSNPDWEPVAWTQPNINEDTQESPN